MAKIDIEILDNEIIERIYGVLDKNIMLIQDKLNVRIYNSDGVLTIEGSESDCLITSKVINHLKKTAKYNDMITETAVNYAINLLLDGREDELNAFTDECIYITAKGKPIKAKTVSQKKYINAIKKNTVVISVGPAGTGKTFLAVTMAVKYLKSHDVSRIVLTRPAVEAGERLGFLPGDLQSKIDPYLRPLYDSLYELLGYETSLKLIEKMVIEIAPLAYMRGRTLDDSFIILDEAQNTTPEQMKMFLTRFGASSKIVVTGDLTQTDLPSGVRSGLADAIKVLDGIVDICIHHFRKEDVIRHKLVQKIVEAYEKRNKRSND